MGKVFDKIQDSNIPNAGEIGCVVATDFLIVSSVSDWGGVYHYASDVYYLFFTTCM